MNKKLNSAEIPIETKKQTNKQMISRSILLYTKYISID